MIDAWEAAEVSGPVGDRPPVPDEWVAVEVPGRRAPFPGAEAVLYRTSVVDPRADSNDLLRIQIEGAFAESRIWLDNNRIGDHGTYFSPSIHVISPDNDDVHELLLLCRSPRDRFGGMHDTEDIPLDRRVPGVWWDVDVSAVPDPYLAEVTAIPRVNGNKATIEVGIVLESTSSVEERATISIRPEDFAGGGSMERVAVKANPNVRTRITHDVDILDPKRWWPYELGPQNRYTIRVKIADQDRTITTGICEANLTDTAITINDTPLAIRGISVIDFDDPVADIDRVLDLGANLVRAHAMVPPHKFHARCDEMGVLVWQDLPLTGRGGFDIERGRTVLTTLSEQFGHHPSMVVFGIHDDPRRPLSGIHGNGLIARLRARWRIWRTSYDRSAAGRIASAVDDRPVITVSGPPGTDPDAWHIYPGWGFGEPTSVEWLIDRYVEEPTIIGEFGAGAFGGEIVDRAAGFDWRTHDTIVGSRSIDVSHRNQADTLQTVVDYLRYRGFPATVAYCLRDTDRAGFGIIARDGTEKLAFESLKTAYQPVQTVMVPPPAPGEESTLAVINDTNESIVGQLTWQLGSERETTTVSVSEYDRMALGAVSIPKGIDAVILELEMDDRTIGNSYALDP